MDIFLGTISCIKFLGLFIAIIYTWSWTSSNRKVELGVIHELALRNLLDMNYHHDTIFSNNSFSTDMSQEEKKRSSIYTNVSSEEDAIKKIAEESGMLDYTFEEGKPETIENLVRSDEVPNAFFEIMSFEVGDKTFLLLIVFCIIWQKGQEPKQDDDLGDQTSEDTWKNNLQGLRIFINSTIGICLVNLISIFK